MRKLFYTIFCLFLFVQINFAQRLSNYSQFNENIMAYNPAAAGSKDFLQVNSIYRNQWRGVNGAPKTFIVSLDRPFFKNNSGLGVTLQAEKIGLVQHTAVTLNYAYRLKLQDRAQLRIGLNGTLENNRIEWDAIETGEYEAFNTGYDGFSPNFGFGLFYQKKNLQVGLSIPQLINNTFRSDEAGSKASVSTILLYAHNQFRLNNHITYHINLLFKIHTDLPFEFNITNQFLFFNRFNIGMGYRHEDALELIFQYQLNERLRAGFAFDFTISNLNRYSRGGLEFSLNYLLKTKNEAE